MGKLEFKIGEQIFQVEDLGEPINSQFLGLHQSHFYGCGFDLTNFKKAAIGFLGDNEGDYSIHDKFFGNFTIIWGALINQGSFRKAEQLWIMALSVAYELEQRGKRIHKGTPYYFWGVTCILNGDLEKGFLLMHQALEDDKKRHQSNSPGTPAYYFVILDYGKQDQFFRAKVLEIASFVEERLKNHCSSRGGTLTLQDFKSKFLEEPSIQEAVFYFIFDLFRLKKLLAEVDQRLKQNVFSSLLQENKIFTLCLIIDNVIKNKNPSEWRFSEQLKFLSRTCSLSLDDSKIRKLNEAFTNDFSGALKSLLLSQYKFQDGSALQSIEEDLAITYGFRNFGAHKIEDQPVVYKNFGEIINRILNSLFFIIEKLYM